MRDIGKIIKLDLISIRPYYTLKNLIIFLVLGVFYSFIIKSTYACYLVAGMFAILFASYPFLIGDESGIDTLYRAFGIKSDKVVLGRYLWSNLIIAICLLVGGIMALGTGIFLKFNFEIWSNLYTLIGIFLFSGIIISFQYPLYFRYGYTKSKSITAGLFLFIAILIFALTYFRENFQGYLFFIAANRNLLIIIGLMLRLCLYLASIKLSCTIYKNRDFV